MIDYQKITDELRTLVQTASDDTVNFLRTAAESYAAACEEVNMRLRCCGDLLRKGLRSEAIQFAEAEPSLLESAASLDFSEKPLWLMTIRRYCIPDPPALEYGLVAELSAAYAIERPLEHLLKEHRILALSHAPLAIRLPCLRRLARADEANPAWVEDVIAFEKARINELEEEIAAAEKARDLAAIDSLRQEMASPDWIEIIPDSLIRRGAAVQASLMQMNTEGEARRCAEALASAFAVENVSEGRRLREKWNSLLKRTEVGFSKSVSDLAAPSLRWLQELDDVAARDERRSAAMAALERYMAKPVPASRQMLHMLYSAASKDLNALPESLKEQYAILDKKLQRKEIVRAKIVSAFAVAVVVVAGLGVFFGVRGWIYRMALAGTVRSLDVQLRDNRYVVAENELKEFLTRYPLAESESELKRIQKKINECEKAEKNRHARYSRLSQIARRSFTEVPSKEAVQSAKKAAEASADEKDAVVLEEDFTKAVAEYVRNRADYYNTRLQYVRDAIDTARKSATDVEASAIALDSAKVKLAEIRNDCAKEPYPIAETSISLRRAEEDARSLAASIRANKEETAGIEKVLAASNSSQLIAAIRRFIERNPDSRLTQGLKAETAVFASHEALEQSKALASELNRTKISELTPAESSDLESKIVAYMEKGNAIDVGDWRALQSRLQAISRRTAETVAKLKETFREPAVADLWMLEDSDGRKLYCKGKPDMRSGVSAISCVFDFELNEKSFPIKSESIVFNDNSPQSVVAKLAEEVLFSPADMKWEAGFGMVIEAIHGSKKMDPILKERLLKETLNAACRGSISMEQAFKRHLRILNEETQLSPSVNWLSPRPNPLPNQNSADADGSQEAEDQRELASRELKQLPSIGEACEAAKNDAAKWNHLGLPEYKFAGILQECDGVWVCRTSHSRLPAVTLFVLQASGKSSTMKKIGSLAAGDFHVRDADASKFIQGQIAYYVE